MGMEQCFLGDGILKMGEEMPNALQTGFSNNNLQY
jgi:hypothetical protein